jgi:hypothetical protein
MPAIVGSVIRDRVAARITLVSAGEWCNWQHVRFWSANPGFESLLPNSEGRLHLVVLGDALVALGEFALVLP